jgi:hypothetical protein
MVAAPAQAATIEISTSTEPAGSALSPGKITGVTAKSELISEPSTWAIVALGFVALGYAGGFRRPQATPRHPLKEPENSPPAIGYWRT